MKRKQVFVRAKDSAGRIGNADVLDLDEDSFRAFTMDILFRAGAVVGIKPDFVKGEEIRYQMKPDLLHEKE